VELTFDPRCDCDVSDKEPPVTPCQRVYLSMGSTKDQTEMGV